MRPVVLKIGGSLLESDAAKQLMRGLAAVRPERLVVVPGGGDFADAVRMAQARHALSEGAAHQMALLAMHMAGIALADLAANCALAETVEELGATWQRGMTPIWVPARMVLAAPDIPSSWDVTSDSLAAWLSGHIGAERLVLAKTCLVPAGIARDARALSAAGIVDAAFPELVEGRTFSWRIASGVQEALRLISPRQPIPLPPLETAP